VSCSAAASAILMPAPGSGLAVRKPANIAVRNRAAPPSRRRYRRVDGRCPAPGRVAALFRDNRPRARVQVDVRVGDGAGRGHSAGCDPLPGVGYIRCGYRRLAYKARRRLPYVPSSHRAAGRLIRVRVASTSTGQST
jgi:hypothetical protein